MKKYTGKPFRLAYAVPKTTCVQLVTQAVILAASTLNNVTTQNYGIDSEEEDGWM